MKPKAIRAYFTRFTVTGGGRFPMDMLRYDSAWPDTSEDARLLNEEHGERTVTLRHVSVHSKGPEVRRWMSYGWKVEAA